MFQFSQVIAPSLGCVLGVVRHFIAMRDILDVRKSGQIGALNPLPFAAQILNCSGWVVYTVLSRNWFIFCTDALGLLVSIWMTFSLYPHATHRVQNQLNAFMVLVAGLWCILALVTIILQEHAHGNAVLALWGWAVSITQVLLMASPLSGLFAAIKQRSSAGFHLGMCLMNLLSSAMWTIYAVATKNLFLIIPSALGTALSLASTMVCFLFRRGMPRSPAEAAQAHAREAEQAVELG